VNSCRYDVLTWHEDEVVDICGTDLLRVENESESYVASSNRDIGWIVEGGIDINL